MSLNNVQHAAATWYHKFNSKWQIDTEVWYIWESHTPNVNNDTGPDGSDLGPAIIAARYPDVTFGAPSGAICKPNLVYCYSYAWAALNHINYQIGPRDMLTWRTDFLNDARGQRTGFKTRYYEFDLGCTHWMGDVVELRPELRFEHAMDAQAYDNPTALPVECRNSQTMLAADAIFHF